MAKNAALEQVKGAVEHFGHLIAARRELERVHGAFQTAHKNPYSEEMRDLNQRWDGAVTNLRTVTRPAYRQGIARHHLLRVLAPVDSWNAVKTLIADLYDGLL